MSRIALILAGLLLFTGDVRADTKGKKLISYGQDWPNTCYIRHHIREMEKRPFDGVVIGLTQSREPTLGGGSLGTAAWGHTRFEAAAFEPAIEDLKATKVEKFTDNFIQVEAMPGDVDFFDDDWSAVIHNIKILARAAKLGGCVGLEFDPEEYADTHVFSPQHWPAERRKGRSEAEYVIKARQRGEALMREINREFSKIKILCLFGPALSLNEKRIDSHNYTLLAPFLEGMCRGADDGSEIIDGYEQSYGYRILPAFARGRETMKASRGTFEDKAAFDRVMRVGFGLWNDNNSGQRGWFADDLEKNHFQPETWQTAVNGALTYSDRYVWIWRERFGEWTGVKRNDAYGDAQIAGRTAPGKFVFRKAEPVEGLRKQMNSAGKREVDDPSQKLLLDLKDGWQFRIDPDDKGIDAAGEWSPIEVGKFWEEQNWDYDGAAWYRIDFKIDAPPTKPTQLVIGAADEAATVYLNGEKLAEHDVGEVGWDQQIVVDVTGKLHAGSNRLAIRVFDGVGPGGLWKPVKIFVAR